MKHRSHVQFGGFPGLSQIFELLSNVGESEIDPNNPLGPGSASTLALGTQASPVFPISLGADNPDMFINSVVGNLSQQLGQQQTDNFLENPTQEGLENLGLSDRITRKLSRKIEAGKPIPRRFRDNIRRKQGELATQTQNQVAKQQDLFGNLLEFFDFDFEDGGKISRAMKAVNRLRSIEGLPETGAPAAIVDRLGFRDDSPFADAQALRINGNNIDMSRTSRDLLLVPDVGDPVLAPGNSGSHVFPGATSVLEIPTGGAISQKIKKLTKEGRSQKQAVAIALSMKERGDLGKGGKPLRLQEGGSIDEILAQMDPNTPVPVQMETIERYVTPDLDIIDTRAQEKHVDMGDEVVTDIVKLHDYVLSDKLTISRNEAENISFGYGGQVRTEDDGETTLPVEVKLDKFFKKGEDELTFAAMGDRIRKMYPVRKGDIFDDRTSYANKKHRLPYLEAVIYMNERKKNANLPASEQREYVFPFKSTFEDPFENAMTVVAGDNIDIYMHNPAKPQFTGPAFAFPGTFQEGGSVGVGIGSLLSSIPNMVASFGSMVQARQQGLAAERQRRENAVAIQGAAGRQELFNAAGSAIALNGITNRDPVVRAPQLDESLIREMDQRIPRSLFANTAAAIAASTRPAVDAILANSGDFSTAINDVVRLNAGAQQQISNLGQQVALENRDTRLRFLDALDRRRREQTMLDAQAQEGTRQNVNNNITAAAGVGTNFVNQQAGIDANRSNALLLNDNIAANADLAARQNFMGAFNFGLGTMSSALGTAASTALPQLGPGPEAVQGQIPAPGADVRGLLPGAQFAPINSPGLSSIPALAPRVPYAPDPGYIVPNNPLNFLSPIN